MPSGPGPAFTMAVDHEGDAVVLRPRGDLDIYGASRFTAEAAAHGRTAAAIVVDLAEVPFMDSSGLGALISLKREVDQDGRRLEVRGIRGDVQRVLEISGVLRLLSGDG